MRHHVRNKKFGRVKKQREALLQGLACSLVRHGRIETTQAKAKSVRPFIERLITKAKNDTIASRRLVDSRLKTEDKTITQKLFGEIAPRYKDRAGGYTRIIKLPPRGSDASPMAIIEFV